VKNRIFGQSSNPFTQISDSINGNTRPNDILNSDFLHLLPIFGFPVFSLVL
jgi:hypothetical protein